MRALAERSGAGRRMSRRFVAGVTVDDALEAAAAINAQGLRVTLDSLGESVTDAAQAHKSAAVYHQLLDAISTRGLDANISLKLTQMGLDVDPALARTIVAGLVEHAVRADSFVRIDMEGSAYTEATIALTESLHRQWPGRVGTVLQAYLMRTASDARRLLGQGIRIRLCKGAYQEPNTIAFAAKARVDQNYSELMILLATSRIFCGLATHDEVIIGRMRRFATETSFDKTKFEFQMLYGVRRDLQRKLAAEGYGVRVYIPFGPEWYPYFMRRLAERPANALFLMRNLFRS